MQSEFDKMKVLPPESVDDIDRAIKELREREELYQRACKEETT